MNVFFRAVCCAVIVSCLVAVALVAILVVAAEIDVVAGGVGLRGGGADAEDHQRGEDQCPQSFHRGRLLSELASCIAFRNSLVSIIYQTGGVRKGNRPRRGVRLFQVFLSLPRPSSGSAGPRSPPPGG